MAGWAAIGMGSLLSWALPAVAAWSLAVVWSRRGARAALALTAGCGAAIVASHATLAGLYGYDPLGALEATREVYRAGIASTRPYEFWVVGLPVAFLVTAGIPLTGAWVLAACRRSVPALALVAIIGVSAVLGFTKAEVERIWLPFVPLLCVGAATVVRGPALPPVLGLLGAQALVISLLFFTIW